MQVWLLAQSSLQVTSLSIPFLNNPSLKLISGDTVFFQQRGMHSSSPNKQMRDAYEIFVTAINFFKKKILY